MYGYEKPWSQHEQDAIQAKAERDMRYSMDRDAHEAQEAGMHDEMCGWEEHINSLPSSDLEWDNAEAMQIGEENPERAWVLTDRDVWHPNPYYKGPPVPHPECDGFYNPPIEERPTGPDCGFDDIPF